MMITCGPNATTLLLRRGSVLRSVCLRLAMCAGWRYCGTRGVSVLVWSRECMKLVAIYSLVIRWCLLKCNPELRNDYFKYIFATARPSFLLADSIP